MRCWWAILLQCIESDQLGYLPPPCTAVSAEQIRLVLSVQQREGRWAKSWVQLPTSLVVLQHYLPRFFFVQRFLLKRRPLSGQGGTISGSEMPSEINWTRDFVTHAINLLKHLLPLILPPCPLGGVVSRRILYSKKSACGKVLQYDSWVNNHKLPLSRLLRQLELF